MYLCLYCSCSIYVVFYHLEPLRGKQNNNNNISKLTGSPGNPGKPSAPFSPKRLVEITSPGSP